VFDYAIPPATMSERDRARHDDIARWVAVQGEPWLTYFEPSALARDLRRLGFTQVEDLGRDELNERYFKGRTDGLRLNGIGRLVKAGR
jgi:O-methyltransferase involved in polyketide biosynthesis